VGGYWKKGEKESSGGGVGYLCKGGGPVRRWLWKFNDEKGKVSKIRGGDVLWGKRDLLR